MIQSKKKDLQDLAHLLDTRFEFMGIRFGLDGLVGLLPVVGDFVTTGISLYIIHQAWTLGCSKATLVRMGLNVAVESVLDMIPLVGNLFDFYWKANIKNLKLLDAHLANPARVEKRSRVILFLIGVFLIGLLIGASYIAVELVSAIIEAFKQ